MKQLTKIRWAALLFVIANAGPLWARPQPVSGLPFGNLGQGGSLPWNIVVLLTMLTLLPAILLSMTPFVRLLVVFHFLRQALGTQSTPSNQTLIGLALLLTFFLMQPVGATIYSDAIVPLEAGHITMMNALDRSVTPLRRFMLKYTREKDLALFVELAREPRPAKPDDLGMRIVAPAYLLSELQVGFRIGAALFLPFLVIDLVVAAVTTSVGMLQLPPVVISTPLKILLFVVVDGWNLLIGSLMKSFSCEDRMNTEQVVALARGSLEIALWLGAPLLLVATIVSLLINVMQTLTSLQDATISTVPRLAAVAVASLLFLPWMLRKLMFYTIGLWSDFHPFLH